MSDFVGLTRQLKKPDGYEAPDLSDLVMEHWEVVSYAGCTVRGKPWYLCRCRCGSTELFPIRRLTGVRIRSGKLVRVVGPASCGCKPDGRRDNRLHKPAHGKTIAKANEQRSIKPKTKSHVGDECLPTSRVGFPLANLRAMIEGKMKLPVGVDVADLEWQLAARTRSGIRYRV